MTTPTTEPAEYHRRVVPPTATAERLGADLAAVLAAIAATYRPLVTESTNAVIEGHGFEVAEQVVADLEQIHDIVHEWLKANDLADVHTGDGLGDMLIGLVPTFALNDALDAHSPDRIADNRARELWVCAKYGIDPDNIDGKMAVVDLEAKCQGDKEAMVTVRLDAAGAVVDDGNRSHRPDPPIAPPTQ